MVADLCVVGGYTQYAIRPAEFLVPVPDGVDPAEAVCIPLAYLTAFQMLTRYRQLSPGSTILAIGASGTVGTALLDLARHFGSERHRYLLGRQHGCGRKLWRQGNRLSRRRLRRGSAQAHRRTTQRAQGPRRRGRRLRRDRRRPFRSLVRQPGVRRTAGRLRVAIHGRRARRPALGRAWLGQAPPVGRVQVLVQWPSRGVVQHHLATERSNRKISRPTWARCSAFCATAPSIPSSSIAYHWRPPAKSIPASTAAGSAAKLF